MTLRPEDIIGAWQLVDTYIENPDGTRTQTQGDNPSGIIMYTADGHMSAITRRSDRELPADGGSAEEKERMFNSYLNYAGRWSLEGNTVTHHIEHALDPNWIGSSRARNIDFQGDRMVYSGHAADGKSNAIIIWEKRA
ncbi:MAG: lipocalin-like domain-containing protein [Alphaproteobacteria bacterium]|nr:lipocalin-like domain-containing protein [Alphaproteobacteria bacterium]